MTITVAPVKTSEVAGQLLCCNARLARAATEALERETGLSLSWYLALSGLAVCDGGLMKMTDLAQQVSITTSGATRIVDRIEDAGYVRRQDCKSDRRVSYVALTDAGRAAVEAAQPIYDRTVKEYLTARLDSTDLETLAILVGKLHG